jgi:hypothetical protein
MTEVLPSRLPARGTTIPKRGGDGEELDEVEGEKVEGEKVEGEKVMARRSRAIIPGGEKVDGGEKLEVEGGKRKKTKAKRRSVVSNSVNALGFSKPGSGVVSYRFWSDIGADRIAWEGIVSYRVVSYRVGWDGIGSDRVASCRMASPRIASHRIASRRFLKYRIAS